MNDLHDPSAAELVIVAQFAWCRAGLECLEDLLVARPVMFPARLNIKGRCIAFDHAKLFPQRLDLRIQLFDVQVNGIPLPQQFVKPSLNVLPVHRSPSLNPCQHYTTLR